MSFRSIAFEKLEPAYTVIWMDIVSNKDSKKKNETLSPFIIIIIKDGKFHGKI